MPTARRLCRALAAAVAAVLAVPALAAAAPGDLDPTWGGAPGGVRVDSLNAASDWATDVVVAPDGRALVLSTSDNGAATTVVVSRYTTAGAPDATFGGGDGRATVPTPLGGAFGEALLLRPDGRIVVVMGNPGGIIQMAVAQLTDTGSPDPAFNGGSTLYLNPNVGGPASLTQESARDAVLLSNGELIVGGQGRYNDGGAVNHLVGLVVSVSPAGVMGGFNTFHPATNRHATVMGMDRYPDDRVILVGAHQQNTTAFSANEPTRDTWVLEISGQSLAASTGFRTLDLSGSGAEDTIRDVAAQPTGAVLAGWLAGGAQRDSLVARIGRGVATAPDLDATFGASGRRVVAVSALNDDFLTTVRIDRTGRIVAEGQDVRAPDFRPMATRLSPGGTVDATFGVAGLARFPNVDLVLPVNERFAGMDVAPDGRIVVGVHRHTGGPTDTVTYRRFGDLTDLAPTISMPSSVRLDTNATMSVRVTNTGDPSGPVTLRLAFSQPVAASVPLAGVACVGTSGQTGLECTMPAVPAGASNDVPVTIRPTLVAPLTVSATTSPTIVDANTGNDTTTAAPVSVGKRVGTVQLWRRTASGRKLACGARAGAPCVVGRAVRLRLAGLELPKRVAAADRLVRVHVFRKRGTRWVRVRRVSTRATVAGTFRLAPAPLPAGTYRLRATTPANAHITAATSAWRYVRVR